MTRPQMPTALIAMSRRIAPNGWPHDRTRLGRCSAMNERLAGGTRRALPAAVSNPALRHHRPRHRGDDTYPDDHARPARTEQAARGAAGQDARASSDRGVQRVVTTADHESPGTTRAEAAAARGKAAPPWSPSSFAYSGRPGEHRVRCPVPSCAVSRPARVRSDTSMPLHPWRCTLRGAAVVARDLAVAAGEIPSFYGSRPSKLHRGDGAPASTSPDS